MADRFYCPELGQDGPILLGGDEARHLARVARRGVGEVVEIFDGRGLGFEARIVAVGKDQVECERLGGVADRLAPLDLTLCVAPPKGDRFDWLVEKATEIGVSRLIPVRAARSVVDPRSGKIDRLRRLVIEASKQCGRNRLMRIEDPMTATQVFSQEKAPILVLAEMSGAQGGPGEILPRGEVALAIGPEGGWTADEIVRAHEEGWASVSFGATRLRVETAAIVGATALFQRAAGAWAAQIHLPPDLSS